MVDMKMFLTRRYVKFIEICAEKCRVQDALCAEKCIQQSFLCAEKCKQHYGKTCIAAT